MALAAFQVAARAILFLFDRFPKAGLRQLD